MAKKCQRHFNEINLTYFSISIKILFCPHNIQMKIQKIVHCAPYYATINIVLFLVPTLFTKLQNITMLCTVLWTLDS